MSSTYSAGIVTAYGAAVRAGYAGTYEDFCRQQAGYAANAQAVETAKAAAESAAANAGTSETNAAASEANAALSETNAEASAIAADAAKAAAESAAANAGTSETNAAASEANAALSETNAEASASDAAAVLASIPPDYTALAADVEVLKEVAGSKRYGVSGIGQSAAALTRLYDAVGLTAQVGTDGNNSGVINDFDAAAPYALRKCVGEWRLVNGRPMFQVNAYLGDEDYAEDGTMGDYVAVECPRSYYLLDGGTLVISAHQYPGYRPFDIFCVDHNPQITIPYYYAPAYALALKDGKAVSLPGLYNEQGNYAQLLQAARTYGSGELGTLAITMPAALHFYTWALFTVEFATQNCQNIMTGSTSLRHSNDDRVTFTDATHILTNNYFAARVAGQYICVIDTSVDINNYSYMATHRVESVTRCDSAGVASETGTHQLIEVTDLGRAYYDYDTTGATEYKVASRPYRTGACNGVSTPSGSPVSNADGLHPCKYRHRENPYGNQNHTTVDQFCLRVGTSDDDYVLEHYYLEDPTGYTPSTSNKPDAGDLATDIFLKLDVETPHAGYVNGYIKSVVRSAMYPDIWIPGETTGGSTTTYYADYAYLVSSAVVRSVRLGGYWNNGAYFGFSYFYGSYAPSNGNANYGGDLCIIQGGGESAA